MSNNLTPKQEAFCLRYLETGNAAEAYRLAYDAGNMKPETVHRTAFAPPGKRQDRRKARGTQGAADQAARRDRRSRAGRVRQARLPRHP